MRSKIHCGYNPQSPPTISDAFPNTIGVSVCGKRIYRQGMTMGGWEKLLRIVCPYIFVKEFGRAGYCWIYGARGLGKESVPSSHQCFQCGYSVYRSDRAKGLMLCVCDEDGLDCAPWAD